MSVKLIVIAGDSNAVGYGPTTFTPGPIGGAYIFGGTYYGAYTPGSNAGTDNNPTTWGPEYEIINRFHTDNPDDILLIVKSAKGSTPLAAIDGMDWNVNSQDEMFDLTTAKIEAARAEFLRTQGYDAPEVSAVFFVSGPNDSYDEARAGAYQANLTDLFAGIRSEWMHDEQGYIGFNRMTEVGPYNATVRVAQWSVDQVDVNAESFKSIGFGMQEDGIHYDAAGRIQLGGAFYSNWIA